RWDMAGRSRPAQPSGRGDGRQPEAPLGGSCCRLLISVRASWKGAALQGQARCRGSIQLHNRDNPKCQILHRPSDTSNSILGGGFINPSSSTPPVLPSAPPAGASPAWAPHGDGWRESSRISSCGTAGAVGEV